MNTLKPIAEHVKRVHSLTWDQLAERAGMRTSNYLAALNRPILSDTQRKIIRAMGYSGELVPVEEAMDQ